MLTNPVVEVAELGVTVGMLAALNGFGVALQGKALAVQQPRDGVRADSVPTAGQFRGQLAGGQRRPAQRRLGVPSAGRLDQRQQRRQQRRIGFGGRFAAAARTPSPAQRRPAGLQFGHALRDPRPRRPGRGRDNGDTPMAQRAGLTGHHQPLLTLIQVRQHRLELRPQDIHHIGIDSHYHIMTDETLNRVVI